MQLTSLSPTATFDLFRDAVLSDLNYALFRYGPSNVWNQSPQV